MHPSSPIPVDPILEYTVAAASALQDVATASGIPFVGRPYILLGSHLGIQNTKFQKERCLQMADHVHHLLCTLMALCTDEEDIQSPWVLERIAQCTLILQKIESCLRAQQDMGRIKRLFKQSELAAQLQNCGIELKEALDTFMMTQGAGIASALLEFNIDAKERHQQLLELISSQSSSFDAISSLICKIGRSSLNTSSGSFSLLPAVPKIFHGRDSDLEHLIESLVTGSARVVILGPGGMGKTTLAVAALHHAKVAGKYPTRHFISCDSAHTNDALVATIASNLALDSAKSTRHLIHHLSTGCPCLIILDNFETPWEPLDSRAKVEELLALLADVPHITMRGAERPEKVLWTHPFLKPLLPLDHFAARQTFIEIADEVHDDSEVDQLLNVTDNIPLAVQLIATVVASEGCQATLQHWKQERTAMLSDGYDKRSNLEISISLSLSSPRMLLVPQAVDLLSLMSLLSDGISDIDLAHSKPPIQDLPKCKSTLIRTSLAYVGGAGEFKVLTPIREYIERVSPPSPPLVRPLRAHLCSLLELWQSHIDLSGAHAKDMTTRLVSNLGNLHNLLEHGLNCDSADLKRTMECIMIFGRLNCLMNRGLTPLLLCLPDRLDKLNDPKLSGEFIIISFEQWQFSNVIDPERSMQVGLEHFRTIQDLEAEARLYYVVASYYRECIWDHSQAQNFYERALSLATECNANGLRTQGLLGLAALAFAHRSAVSMGYIFMEQASLRWQALGYTRLGNFKHSLELLQKAKLIVACDGIPEGEAQKRLMNIEGNIYGMKTDYVKARAVQEIILCQTSPVLAPIQHASCLLNIANLDVMIGASAEIVAFNVDAAASLFQSTKQLHMMSSCAIIRAHLQLREGREDAARAEYIRLFSATQSEDRYLASGCLVKLADSANPVHTATDIARWAVVFMAFMMRRSARDILLLHDALRCFGDVLAEQGMDDTALSIFTVALEGFTWMDVHQSKAECMQSIGDLHMRCGELSKAATFWKEARPLFEVSSQRKSVGGIDRRLAELEQHHQANLDHLSSLNVPDLPWRELPIGTEASRQAEESAKGTSHRTHIGDGAKVLAII
ncbi:hypothetical protein K438DRAFT_1776647 [Mycena galopus ATCC 62051]|nr:hypothetical protein K438DRAFT_1776647 [Mycena galopus ATCC 62051]